MIPKPSENIKNQEQVKKQPSPSPSLDDVISKPREPPSGKRTHQPIILTGSKGNYLKTYACHDVEEQIVWLPKSGAKIEDTTQWLKSNISKKIINYGDIWLYVWMGTRIKKQEIHLIEIRKRRRS
jgi:hypothetical protein